MPSNYSIFTSFFLLFLFQTQRIGFKNLSPKNSWVLRATTTQDSEFAFFNYAAVLLPHMTQWVDITALQNTTGQSTDSLIYQVCDTTGSAAVLYVNGDQPKCAVYSGAKINITVRAHQVTVNALSPAALSVLTVMTHPEALYTILAIPQAPQTCLLIQQSALKKTLLVNFDQATQFEPRAHYPCDALPYTQRGVNTLRLGFTWEYLQNFLGQDIPIDWSKGGYAAQLVLLVQAWKNFTVILTLYDHMHYSYCAIGTPDCWVKAQRYQRVWQDIAQHFINDAHVVFDLMHQPAVQAGKLGTDVVLRNQNLATAAIRATGAQHFIFFEGNKNSSIENWHQEECDRANSVVFRPEKIHDAYSRAALSVSISCHHPDTIHALKKFGFWLKATHSFALISEIDAHNSQPLGCVQEVMLWGWLHKHIVGVDASALLLRMAP